MGGLLLCQHFKASVSDTAELTGQQINQERGISFATDLFLVIWQSWMDVLFCECPQFCTDVLNPDLLDYAVLAISVL